MVSSGSAAASTSNTASPSASVTTASTTRSAGPASGQFWLAQQRGDDADRGFEVDNSESEFGARPLTAPRLANVTLIGDPDEDEGSDSGDGITLRRGAGTVLYNAVVTGFKKAAFDIDNGITTENEATGNLVVDYSVFHNNGSGPCKTGETEGDEEVEANGFLFSSCAFLQEMNSNNIFTDESPIVDPYNLDAPNFRSQGAASDNGFDAGTLGSFFETTTYRGAVAPEGNDWTQEPWISYKQN